MFLNRKISKLQLYEYKIKYKLGNKSLYCASCQALYRKKGFPLHLLFFLCIFVTQIWLLHKDDPVHVRSSFHLLHWEISEVVCQSKGVWKIWEAACCATFRVMWVEKGYKARRGQQLVSQLHLMSFSPFENKPKHFILCLLRFVFMLKCVKWTELWTCHKYEKTKRSGRGQCALGGKVWPYCVWMR